MNTKHESSTINRYRQTLTAHRQDLRQRYHVSSLGLFGSRLRGESRPDSDLDLLVAFSETPSLLQFINLRNYLSDLLGERIDLVMRDSLKQHIGREILNEVVAV